MMRYMKCLGKLEMFVKLLTPFDTPLFTTVSGLESFAGLDNKGVYHNNIWTPDKENIYGVIPKRYWTDFEMSIMTINSVLLPHIDSALKTTINFYIRTDNCRTVFYEAKDNSEIWDPGTIIKKSGQKTDEIAYVTNVYQLSDVNEIGSFIAKDNDAWLLDVSKIHNVEPLGDFTLRKVITLRTNNYNYDEVYTMLQETGNL